MKMVHLGKIAMMTVLLGGSLLLFTACKENSEKETIESTEASGESINDAENNLPDSEMSSDGSGVNADYDKEYDDASNEQTGKDTIGTVPSGGSTNDKARFSSSGNN